MAKIKNAKPNTNAVGQILPSPSITIRFKTLATTAIQRSALGILCMVVKDNTWTGDKWVTLKTMADISQSAVDSKTYDLILLANQTYVPGKILIRFQGRTEQAPGEIVWEDISDILAEINVRKINWLACPSADQLEDTTVVTYVKQAFGTDVIQKTIKYVTSFATNTDHVAIVELGNAGTYYSSLGEFTAQEYTVAIAGAVAGCPLNRSLDNEIMKDLISVTDFTPTLGKFSLYNDDGVVRVNYAVNSKTTFDSTWKEQTRKIKIVEGMCLVVDDIRDTFKKYWLGKYLNGYDEKMSFCSNVTKVYFIELQPNVLSADYYNYVDINVESQQQYIIIEGGDPTEMTELEVRKYPTGDSLFLAGDLRFADTMANLDITFTM